DTQHARRIGGLHTPLGRQLLAGNLLVTSIAHLAVGHQTVGDIAPLRDPLGDRRPTGELAVVGMRHHDQYALGWRRLSSIRCHAQLLPLLRRSTLTLRERPLCARCAQCSPWYGSFLLRSTRAGNRQAAPAPAPAVLGALAHSASGSPPMGAAAAA